MDFRLQNDGAIETDGDLAIKAKTDNEAITISNEGTADKTVSMISYNGELSVGGANEEVNRYDVYLVTSFNDYTSFYGHDIKLDVNRLIFDEVDEGLVAGRNFEVDTKYLWLTDSSAFLVSGVEEDGVMRITTENGDASNSFLNYGAIHSNGDADMNVNKLTNLITGGLSATGDMEISALTTVQNEGAIFTGGDLEINRDILNTERFLPESETDENGVTTLLHTYTTNAGSINVSGDFSHSLERFNNFIDPGFTADFTEDPKLIVGGDATFTGLDSDPETQVNNEDGAQIIVGGTLRFDDIKDILNKNSTISAQNMIASTDRSGATFINLVEDIFEQGPCINFVLGSCFDEEPNLINTTNYSSTISASTLSLTGYTLQNQGGASDTTNFINPDLTGISVDKDGETGSADSSATSSSNEDSGATGATGQTSGDANAGTSNTSVSGTSEKAEDDQDDLGINGSGAGSDLNKDADNVDPAPTSNLKAHNKSSTKADQIAAQQGTPGGAISSVNTGGQTTAINFSGLVINLPTSPNGQFVQSRDPQSGFLIETNPRFKNNLTHVGSNYLLERLNYDPDNFVRRLGDSAYETKLVREQLINQTGTNLLNRNLTEAQQMTGLMNNASSIAQDRGFQVGKALTPNQIANLDRDIVWMVETEVNGQKVLAPVVYLSANTRSLFDANNANILADNIDFDITQMANSGNIQGSETVNIRSKGDITNIGGSISGGKVQLESTEGNIQNISTKKRTTKWGNYNESIDNAASIVAEDSIYLKAAYDFNTSAGILKTTNKEGAGIAVEAGRDINVSTIALKSRTSGSKGKLTKKTKQSQTVVDSASNVIFSAGNNANITAIDMDAGGNIVLAAKNDVNLLDAKELVYKRSAKKTKSCYMCNGSIKSTKTTQTTKRSSNSVGNDLNASGDLNISAGNNVTSVGSEFKAGGDVGISAGNDIKLLTGQNITTTTTETTIKRTGAFTSSDEVGAYNERNNANAGASGEGRMAFSETTNLTETNINIKNVGNNIESGGDIILNAGNDITTVGADFKAAETIGMKGKNINNLVAQDVDVTVSNMDQTSVGLYAEGGASAQGSKQVGGNSGAGAGVGTGVYVNNTESNSVSGSTTAKTTNLEGKNIIRQASENITDEGTQMEASENIMQKAKNINSFAAENTTFSSSETTSNEAKVGAYADAGADTGGVDRNTGEDGKTGASYTQQGAGGEAGGKVKYDYSNNKSSSNSSDAVTSNMKAGGNIVSISENDTTFEGTNIEAGGNVGIGAENLNFKAAQDTSSSSKSNTDVSVEAKVAKGTDASKSVSAEAGVNVGSENKSSNEAVTGNIKSGGDTTILTTGDQTFEGVDINSNGDLNKKAGGVINDNSASSSSNASKNEIDVNVSTGFSKSKNSGGTKQKDRSGSLGVNVTSIDKASSSSKDTKVNATGDNITESGANNVDLNSLEK
jgi:hypothetical protein